VADRPVIVCVGDLVEDVVVTTQRTPRVGTDTDASIVRRRGGSAANVAVAVSHAGGIARFVGSVGHDPRGERLVEELVIDDVEPFVRRGDRPTGTVIVLVAEGERSFLTDRGASSALDAVERSAVTDPAIVHIAGYSFVSEPLVDDLRAMLEADHTPRVSVDASSVALLENLGRDRFLELCASVRTEILLANEDEAATLRLPEAALAVGISTVVVKQGKAATLGFTATDRAARQPVPIDEPFDPTGAGDAFAGGFLVAYGSQAGLSAALAAGNRTAYETLTNPRRSW
jgi:sugar/nucleoside kinase (ribokinase family)